MVWLREFTDAWRRLARRPGYSALSILMLGIGLGLTLFVYDLVHALILSPLPYPQPDRLVAIGEVRQAGAGMGDTGVGIDDLDSAQYRVLSHSLGDVQALGAYARVGITVDSGHMAVRYDGGRFTASMMDLLGAQPILGRGLESGDEAMGAPAVVLIGEGLWRHAFAADPGIIGRAVRVNGAWSTVIGVLPASFGFPGTSQVWQPLRLEPAGHEDIAAVARLRPGATAGQLRAALATQAAALQRVLPADAGTSRLTAKAFGLSLVPENLRRWVWLMFGAAALVLLLACVNVASLQLVQAINRRRELALRSALGGARWRLMLGALAESLWLSAAALAIALPLVALGSRWLVGMYAANNQRLSSYVHLGVGPAVIAAAVVAALLATGLAGLVPAWRASRMHQHDALRDGDRGSGGGTGRLIRILVVLEIALTVVLLVGAGTFVRALDAVLTETVVGADHADAVLTARIALPPATYRDDASRIAFLARVEQRLRETGGVLAASAANAVPGAVLGSHESVAAAGQARPVDGWARAQLGITGIDFLDVFGVHLVAGRFFTARDDAGAMPVTVVDATAAAVLWPGRDPVGQQLVLHPGRTYAKTLRVIGVVEPLQLDKVLERSLPRVLLPVAQAAGESPLHGVGIAVHARGPATSLAPRLASLLRDIDADAALYDIRTQASAVAGGRLGLTVLTEVFAALGLVALFLAAAGLYGVLAFSVAQRIRELGIRRAIGADHWAIVRTVARQLAWQLGIGLTLGLLLAWPWSGLLADPGLRTTAHDVSLMVAVALLVLAISATAALAPTMRALRVDPLVALRSE